jgi:L-iditol 2-dehydrogenase
MVRMMKVGLLHGARKISCELIPVPEVGPKEVLVAIKIAGICGSDVSRFLRGTFPYDFKILGHECAGEVVKVGSEVTAFKPGERVAIMPVIPCRHCDFCQAGEYSLCDNFIRLGTRVDGCFAEYVKIGPENLLKLSPTVDYESASLLEPSSVALHTVKRPGIAPGDVVAVLGCGPIGLLIAQWATILGARRVFAVDIAQVKLEIARKTGIADCINAKDKDPVEVVMRKTQGKGADLVLEAAGSETTLEQSIRMTRKLGKVALLGLVEQDVTLPQKTITDILRHELTIYGVYDADTKPVPFNSWEASLHFMETGRLDVKSLITHRFKIDEIKSVFEEVSRKREDFNKVLFVF